MRKNDQWLGMAALIIGVAALWGAEKLGWYEFSVPSEAKPR